MTDWISCQIDSTRVFQVSTKTTGCRTLEWNDKGFAERALANYPKQAKGGQSLCNLGDFSLDVFSIGGWDGGRTLQACTKFKYWSNKWETVPNLCTARAWCSSCQTGNKLYAFCGYQTGWFTNGRLNSIEKIEISYPMTDKVWQLIPQTNFDADFTPRASVVVVPVGSTRILICGGSSDNNELNNQVFEMDTFRDRIYKKHSTGRNNLNFESVCN